MSEQEDKNENEQIKEEQSIGSKISTGAKNVFSFIKRNTWDKVDIAIKKAKNDKELNKFFESKAVSFFVNDTVIYGIKRLNDNSLIFRCTDAALVGAGFEIAFDKQILVITDIDKNDIFNFCYDDKEYELPCFRAIYKIKDKEPAPQSVTYQVNNTVSLGDNASFNGDIQQIAQINADLSKIGTAIENYKPPIFGNGKKQKEEAKTLFVSFKSAINNEIPKDKSLFDKFISILKVIAPTVVSIATALWR